MRAAEAEDAELAACRRQRQPACRLSPLTADEREHRLERPFLRDGDDDALLCFPDGRRRAMIGHSRRHEWKRNVIRLQNDQTHLVGGFVVQRQREVVERDDRMQVIAQEP